MASITDPQVLEADAMNPMGTDGFEFVEFCHPDPAALDHLFTQMSFVPVARHRSKAVTLYRQGGINLVLNAEPGSFAARFAEAHGPSAPAMAFRVVDAQYAFDRAIRLGARPVERHVDVDLDELARRHVERDVVERFDAVGIGFGQVLNQ
mgnify:CR=1 FL=1